MTNNSSLDAGKSSGRLINDRVIFIQVLVAVLLCINLTLILTFFMKEIFYTNMRYILFANTLFSDCINIMTNVMLLFVYFSVPLQTWLCLFFCHLSSLCNYVTPLTLTAMSLERYVAVCMPLRHAELCTAGRALQVVFIIHSLSIIPYIVVFLMLLSSVTFSFFTQHIICSVDALILHRWQGHVRSAISQFYFLIMCILIAFSYVQIIKVAKAASGNNKESTRKGLRTVILHAFQLFLCLIQLWTPFIEAAVLQIDFSLFINVRYINYILFNLSPRCLSPLIYGLRDEAFLVALKQYVFCCPFIDTVKR
ncbi:growth hormone secretagogue receptor type 1-like [Xiphophorus maculatus]|uniref:growth hormone secretagogue receptor type 1-like n=1 Tax=Xiphophorus maculatus TaxID=8083 RepID=UPI000C6D4355|nr:growth hormone secretagogue receptor type 1-like [Xiphophorus maculatus]